MLMIMEPVHQQPPQPAPKPSSPPVMDVRPPKTVAAEPVKEPPKAAVDLPVAEPGDEKQKTEKPAKPAPAKLPKQPKNGVGLAIVATVVIVLALSAMMVYAYLRTNGTSL